MSYGIHLIKLRTDNIILNNSYSFFQQVSLEFRNFISIFQLGESMLIIDYVLVNNRKDFFIAFKMFEDYSIKDEKYNATLDRIFELEELELEYNKFLSKHDHWNIDGFMKIGLLYHGDVLLLGMESRNYGEIWRWGNGLNCTQSCKLDNNIFEFMSRLRREIDYEQLDDLGISVDQLYKNWGEDFWRVREE